MIVQKLIRSPECAHGTQDTGDPGRKQLPQNAQIVFLGGRTRYGDRAKCVMSFSSAAGCGGR